MIVNGWKPLTIITKHSILDVATALDPPLATYAFRRNQVKAFFNNLQVTLQIHKHA